MHNQFDHWSVASITHFSSAENPSGIPDVSTGSSQEVFSVKVEEKYDSDGSLASFFKADDSGANASDDEGRKFLRFVHKLTDNQRLEWETTLWNNRLYVKLPSNLTKQGSRDSLVALLDAAEDHLGCTHVIICLPRDIEDRAEFIRTFKFIGFEMVPPDHPQLLNLTDHLFMAYDI